MGTAGQELAAAPEGRGLPSPGLPGMSSAGTCLLALLQDSWPGGAGQELANHKASCGREGGLRGVEREREGFY